ncbi:MAG: monovalent cation/H+ antiporter subunit D [Vicinamibacteria bacterium]|jgi:multicomponent K+:H+ antiporter subunit D
MTWIAAAMPHLVVAPIVLPLIAAAVMLGLGDDRRVARAYVNVVACVAGLAIAIALFVWSDRFGTGGVIAVYLPANWPVPYGIVLVADRLAALMLVLTGVLGLTSVLYATARWHRAGVHFHPLFQLQLMGLNGAFLTGDLFNLFVFFEVMLAASYGLLLHGSGNARVRWGLHYIAINLIASSVFLIGVAMLYGVTGTLNLADMAQKLAFVPTADRGLLHAGVAILAVAFLAKAAIWPLGFWLAPAYAAASAPAAALFVIMTKVGVYAIIRLSTLFFSGDGVMEALGADTLVGAGLCTLALGAFGMLATQRLVRLAGASIAVSSGTLIAAVGFGSPSITAAALYYLASSTLALSALYLLVELCEREHDVDTDQPDPEPGEASARRPFALESIELPPGVNLDDERRAVIGRAMPATVVFLALAYLACALVVAGLPPLSGFLAKVAMLSAALDPAGLAAARPAPRTAVWVFFALLILSGLVATLALSREGIKQFWNARDRLPPRLRMVECVAVAIPLLACVAMAAGADRAMRFATDTARALHRPTLYVQAVTTARPVPPPRREAVQ